MNYEKEPLFKKRNMDESETHYYIIFMKFRKFKVIESKHDLGFIQLRHDSKLVYEIDVRTYYKFIYEYYSGNEQRYP